MNWTEPLYLFLALLGTFIFGRLLDKFYHRPGAKDKFTIRDTEGKKISFEILRNASAEERQRIIESKRQELQALSKHGRRTSH